jgi:hypothetical protein
MHNNRGLNIFSLRLDFFNNVFQICISSLIEIIIILPIKNLQMCNCQFLFFLVHIRGIFTLPFLRTNVRFLRFCETLSSKEKATLKSPYCTDPSSGQYFSYFWILLCRSYLFLFFF